MRKKITVLLSAILMVVFCGAFAGCGKGSGEITVRFETGAGTSVNSQKIYQGETALRPFSEPYRAGYGFYDWYLDSALTKPFNFNQTILYADTTVYAKYIKDVIVSFVLSSPDDGGTGDGEDGENYQTVVVSYGKDYDSIPMPDNDFPDDFIFAGWFGEALGKGVQYTNSSSTGINWPVENCVVYSHWMTPTEGLKYTANPDGQSYSLEADLSEVALPEAGGDLEIVVAGMYEGKPVTSVAAGAFMNSAVKSVVLPDSIESIGAAAFKNCSNLTSIALPSRVTAIEAETFYGAENLSFVSLPRDLVSIGDSAFRLCKSLTALRIPDNAGMTIGSYAFYGCLRLERLTLPSSLTAVSDQMFAECASLASIEIPSAVTEIGDRAFMNCLALKKVELFQIISDSSGVKEIKTRAFRGCSSLKSFNLEGVETIGSRAFQETGLREITIPTTVTAMGVNVFANSAGLKKIYVKTHAGKPLGWQAGWDGECPEGTDILWRQ
jgi:uncharacterized repeat protein (TIGR02543 family)